MIFTRDAQKVMCLFRILRVYMLLQYNLYLQKLLFLSIYYQALQQACNPQHRQILRQRLLIRIRDVPVCAALRQRAVTIVRIEVTNSVH